MLSSRLINKQHLAMSADLYGMACNTDFGHRQIIIKYSKADREMTLNSHDFDGIADDKCNSIYHSIALTYYIAFEKDLCLIIEYGHGDDIRIGFIAENLLNMKNNPKRKDLYFV